MAAHLFAAIDVGSFELEMGIYEATSRMGYGRSTICGM